MMKRDIRTGEKIEKISSRELAGALVEVEKILRRNPSDAVTI